MLVDFYAEWCGPPKTFPPTMERFTAENQDAVRLMKIDVEEFAGIAGEAGIRSGPMLLVVKDGQVVVAKSGGAVGCCARHFRRQLRRLRKRRSGRELYASVAR